MPYGLFNYGGTIHTMGESPTPEQMGFNPNGFPFPVLGTGTQADPFRPDTSYKFPTNTGTDGTTKIVTKAIPEDGPIDYRTGQVIPESYVTWAQGEGGPVVDPGPDYWDNKATTMMIGEEGNPYTDRMPEEGPINPPTGGTGGCPAGYAPAQTGGVDPVAPSPWLNGPQVLPGQMLQFYGKQ